VPLDKPAPYVVLRTPPFEAAVGSLRKRYPKVDTDIDAFLESAEFCERPRERAAPIAGIPHYWKARIKIGTANVGKRGGLRLIYRIVDDARIILPVVVYSKRDLEDVTKEQIANSLGDVRPFFLEHLVKKGLDPKKFKLD